MEPNPNPPPTVAIGVSSSTRSRATQRAVRWALAENDHFKHHTHHFILIHVIPPITTIPTPSRNLISVKDMDADVVSIYRQDMISRCGEIFLPFKRLFKTRKMETLVLEDDNPAYALLSYVSERGCKSLVLGCSSSNCITRKIKGPDVSSTVLKLAPNTCDIYLIARRKILTKLASSSLVSGTMAGQGKFTQTKMSATLDTTHKRVFSFDSVESNLEKSLEKPSEDFGISTSIIPRQILRKGISESQRVNGDESMTFLNDMKQIELERELERMQLELRNTLELYDRTCGDLVLVQRKLQSLSSESLEEARRANVVLDREKQLRKVVTEEKAKLLEAMKEIEVSKQLLAREAKKKEKAEMNAFIESWKKQETIDALFASDKRYRKYSRVEIEIATESFSDAKMIGEGGYGKVYKCTLDHTPVAIKISRTDASDKKQEFLKEVEVLSQLRHPYLVLLLAACPEIGCLVYEYMENGSLEERLFCRKGTKPLPWFVRFRIALEVASGLAFLHNSKPEPIVHCDLKPGNILLDRNWVSKIGDVGLAKLMSDIVPDNITMYKETVRSGTIYYIDPEYYRTGIIRPKSDVYAFGVIVLQLLTARPPKGLITVVEDAINSGCFADVLDKSISDWPLAESEELAHIALKCSKLRCRDRPDLEGEVLPVLKKLQSIADSGLQLQKDSTCAPNHYICPILQEIMNDPYIAADGFTYEYRAIKLWLEKYSVSPVTSSELPHTMLTPNNTLLSSIQEWRRHIK